MKRFRKFLPRFWMWLLAASFLTLPVAAVWAGPQTQAGPYHVELTTDPATIPVGKAKLLIKVTDSAGKPVAGAKVRAIARMPGMAMGEREETARPQPGQPGVYAAPANFPMGGGYAAEVKIAGPQGPATASVSLQTGQNTASGRSLSGFMPWLIGVIVGAFMLYRVRRSGQQFYWRGVFNRQVLGGLALLAAMLAISLYAIKKYRRPGAMTPIEAQAMEMNLPAPSGTIPVEFATVQRGTVMSSVRYAGQAVGYIEQDVYPRVTGTLIWMPFYAGERVRRGQLLARLDTSQIAPQVAQQRAAQAMAEQGTEVSRLEYQQSLGAISQAEAELGQRRGAVEEARSDVRKASAEVAAKRGAVEEMRRMEAKAKADVNARRAALEEARGIEKKSRGAIKEAQSDVTAAQGALAEAQSDVTAAQEERANAGADVESAQTQVVDAQAQLQAAQADADYWTKEIARMKVLLHQGAVSKDEFQREQAQAENASAKVRQAQARINQVQAEVRGAQSRVRKADATIKSAEAKARQAQSRIEGSGAKIEQAQADIASAGAKVQQAAADIESAQAEVGAAHARVRQAASDVTGAQSEVASAGHRVEQQVAELMAHHAHVRQTEAAANAARQRIAQAQAGVQQAGAGVAGARATLGYAEIRSEIDGVVTQRLISPGVLINPGQAILKTAQIRPIRLQANVAEADLRKVQVGSIVTVRSQSDPKKAILARVSSIAPTVDAASRTGIVEAIVPNASESFLPGQYVMMEIATGQNLNALRVPSRAIQWRTIPSGGIISTQATPFVWIAQPNKDEAGQFTVQQVQVSVGLSGENDTEVLSGLKAGQRVVVTGQQNLKDGDAVMPPENADGMRKSADAAPEKRGEVQSASVVVTTNGFEPANLKLRRGVPTRVTFERKTDQTCATEVVFPDYGIKKSLPLNQPVVVEFTPQKEGAFTFSCGMNMIHGKAVVR